MKVMLVDDDAELMQEWADSLRTVGDPAMEIEPVVDPAHLIDQLENRRLAYRLGDFHAEPHRIDDADVLILDYDLGQAGHALTGRRLAYLARCFSGAATIVLMNEHGDSTFDFTMSGDFSCYADVEIGATQIANQGLWSDQSRESFRPWHWPCLKHEVHALRQCAVHVRDGGTQRVVEALGLGPVLERLPTSAVDALTLGLSDLPFGDLTFNDLLERVTSPDIGETAFLQRKDRLAPNDAARVIAARLRRWVNRVLAPSQDVLVDAPHVVSRFPSLLAGSRDAADQWSLTAKLSEPAGLDEKTIRSHRLVADAWSDRPRWLWPLLQHDPAIVEVGDPFAERPPTSFVFCEDTSRFVEETKAYSFSSDLRPPFSRRWAERVDSVDYRPRSRLI